MTTNARQALEQQAYARAIKSQAPAKGTLLGRSG